MQAAIIAHWVLQPLHGRGYQLWTIHHNCRQHGCLRLGHAHPDHGLPACAKHHHSDVTPRKR